MRCDRGMSYVWGYLLVDGHVFKGAGGGVMLNLLASGRATVTARGWARVREILGWNVDRFKLQ